MKLTLLGTGSPKPSIESSSAGYLIEAGTDTIMMECGPGSVFRLLQTNKSVTDITHVVISHLHFDHWLDLIRLILNRWDFKDPKLEPLKIWAPKGIKHIIERTIGPDGALKLDLTARTNHKQSLAIYQSRGGQGERPWPEVDVVEMDENTVIKGEGWEMTFEVVPHHQPYLLSYGIRICDELGTLAYSSDITQRPADGPPPGLVRLAESADVLLQYTNVFGAKLHEYAHKPAEITFHQMLAQMARDASVPTFIATHTSPHLNVDAVRERIIADICAIYPGRFIWGRDLMSFDITSR